VGVTVDKAGRDNEPVGIERAVRRRTDPADLDNPTAFDPDIRAKAG
jgi:hypothetical protein